MNKTSTLRNPGFLAIRIAAFVIIASGIYFAKSLITPFLLALFISIICAQPIAWLEKKKVPNGLAVILVILAIVSLFLVFAGVIGVTISSFLANVHAYKEKISIDSGTFIKFLHDKGLKISDAEASNFIQLGKILEITSLVVNEMVNMVGNMFVVFLIVAFILLESGSFGLKTKAIFKGSGESFSFFSTIITNIRHYLWIKTMICLLTALFVYIALMIIGVDYPLLWAVIAGLMNYIPNIGSIIAAVPAVLFALVQVGLGGAVWTLFSFLLVNNVLGNFIEPKIMGRGLGLSTLVVFLSLLFWGFLLGTVGMFLSVPLTMAIKIILEQDAKTKWIAILLGSSAEARHLHHG